MVEEEKTEEKTEEEEKEESKIFVLKTTANREDQVMDFISSHVLKKRLKVYSIVRPHGMRGYIFIEAPDRGSVEESFSGVPYAKGLLRDTVKYEEIEPMIEQSKAVINMQKSDIVEIISGPFKREKGKIVRVDMTKEEVIVELLETAIPIPLTLKLDAVKVIRREKDEEEE